MPKYVIERYLLPIYQRLIIDAPDIRTACQEAVEDDDWESAEDGDGSVATTISALWEDQPEYGPRLEIPAQFTDDEMQDLGAAGHHRPVVGFASLVPVVLSRPVLDCRPRSGRDRRARMRPRWKHAGRLFAVAADRSLAKAAKLFKGVEDVKGRWRGGHILGTSEIRYEDWPTTEEVLETGTDISDKVLRYLVAISHY
jgi:hypothetical protein